MTIKGFLIQNSLLLTLLIESPNNMKILCILYDDPKTGMPDSYPLNDLPDLEKYPDGMSLPSPKSIDFTPGQLLGCVSGELGLRQIS